MKRWALFLSLYLAACLLASCGAAGGALPAGQTPAAPENPVTAPANPGVDTASTATMVCRVVEEDDGGLLLAGEADGAVYWLDASALDVDPEEGALVEVLWNGTVLETFPAQLGTVTALTVQQEGFDDRCALYLDVLEDLWDTDEGLNAGLTQVGVDLSQTSLTPGEQAAVAWAFGQDRGLEAVQGTYGDLVDRGFITGEVLEGTDARFWQWRDGCLFSIAETGGGESDVTFDAQKWRSGTGADFFTGCIAARDASGAWGDYGVGGRAIA